MLRVRKYLLAGFASRVDLRSKPYKRIVPTVFGFPLGSALSVLIALLEYRARPFDSVQGNRASYIAFGLGSCFLESVGYIAGAVSIPSPWVPSASSPQPFPWLSKSPPSPTLTPL